ncbi:nucleoside diphosphate kinase regulator [Solimonas fluminis]|nr:nucleoside diphosphate kinase regulator [Solimonas fluminis]
MDHPLQSPPLLIEESMESVLRRIAERSLGQAPEVAQRLLEEIDRAELVADGQMPEDVVAIGSSVTYRDESGGTTQGIGIVMPAEADPARRRVSVMTPVGAALIGLRKGQRIACEIAGRDTVLTVLDVGRGS